VWINAGSVYEAKEELGLAHLLEHIVFKGTHTTKGRAAQRHADRGADGLARRPDERLHRARVVCYHVKVLADHLPPALELIATSLRVLRWMRMRSNLKKGVILEEIKSVEDTPEELVEDLFTETIWHRSRWGRSILARRAVSATDRARPATLSEYSLHAGQSRSGRCR
jgi:predicted Zn-dependent peptidase